MTEHLYCPIVRTRAAELKGLSELDPTVRAKLLPVIELTRSRRTTRNPGGDVRKSLEATLDIFGDQPFIVDLTSLQSQQNSEIESLLDASDGFSAWTNFVQGQLPRQCIPVAHLLEPFDGDEFRRQVMALREKFQNIAIRVPTSYLELPVALDTYAEIAGNLQTTALILDAGYVSPATAPAAVARLNEMLNQLGRRATFLTASCSSSFPVSVVSAGGEDASDQFTLLETWIDGELRRSWPELIYGDYAAIHPIDFVGTVTNWVPRVDVMLATSFYYYRYRRSDGGYVRAAAEALRDPKYVSLSCWGDLNVRAAAAGNPLGRSPSHWIASRVNFHISRQVNRLTT
jgi:hypothetical protein